jgi:hypothetical protein
MHAEELAVMMILRGQVHAAMWTMQQSGHPGANERDVETAITRPLWNLFLRAISIPENTDPTPWNGLNKTVRVWGSETKVIESDEYWSWSRPKLPC